MLPYPPGARQWRVSSGNLPAISTPRENAIAGGMIGYGSSLADAFRRAGVYPGRILRGDKPTDLPVGLATRIELTINLKTAKALGITFPPTILRRADAMIEQVRSARGCGSDICQLII
jgi:putative ABC transport system substrate-binding protein